MCSQQCAQTMKYPMMSVKCKQQQLYIEMSEGKIWLINDFDLLFARTAKKFFKK